MRNKCLVRASSLAYTSILALIPMLAVMVIVSTALLKQESDKRIDELIDRLIMTTAPQLDLLDEVEKENEVAPQPEDDQNGESVMAPTQGEPTGREAAIGHIKQFINNVDSGQLGFVATIMIVVVAISLLSTIENTFNDMWGVSKGRNLLNRVMRYWTALTLGPVCLISAIAITTGSRFEKTREWIESLPILGEWFFKLVPLAIIATGLSILYKVVPNTRVGWKAAFVGGGVAGFLWQVNNILSVVYVSRVATYSKIYGSIAMVPVFLLALYFSWLILLFGSQVAYSFQNRKIYLQNVAADNVNQLGMEFLAVRIMAFIGQKFIKGEPAPTASIIARHLDIASRLASKIVTELKGGGLLSEVNHEEEVGYTPSKPLESIFLSDILRSMREVDGNVPNSEEGEDRDRLEALMNEIRLTERTRTSRIHLAHLANGTQPEVTE